MLKSKRSSIWLLAPLILLISGAMSHAASSGVRDEGHFFSQDAINQAERTIQQIDQRHQKDLLIETFPTIPADKQTEYEQEGKDAFFEKWAYSRAQSQAVNGIYVLICRQPSHLFVAVGNKTRQRLFTSADGSMLRQQLISAFTKKNFDQGLIEACNFVLQRMDSHASASTGMTPPPPGSGRYVPPSSQRGWGFGGLACIIIGVVLLIVMLRGIFGRSGGAYYGGQGGYYPPQGGAYPPGGYYGGGYGGGGGFGRGFLGGLLGGALGGYAAQQWTQHQQGGSYTPPASGGYDPSAGPDTSFSGGGGDFGDSGGGGGGDFGGGGGGGDFGGGGGDFGGGGGDSGGSGGGDF